MSSHLNSSGNLLEPAVGEAALLNHLNLDNYENIDIYDIHEKYLEKCPNNKNIMKFNEDFLMKDIKTKYKNICMNPPYIKIQDLSEKYRKFLKEEWGLSGSTDIYYGFIYKCIELLDDDGVLVMITPNSYLNNSSAKGIRKYLLNNKLIKKIIDFKSEKIFPNVSTYTCITIISKTKNDEILYINYNNKEEINIKYSDICDETYNIFNKKTDKTKITLKDICIIRNGLATLKDEVFMKPIKLYDEPCWKIISTSESDKFIIYPYDTNGQIIEEEEFKVINPETYKYLESNKSLLESRENNGGKEYKVWYQYGRTQALKISKNDQVMYLPSFTDPNNINYNIKEPQLYIHSIQVDIFDKNYTYENIKDIIEKNKKYLIDNCNRRGGGWINLKTSVLNRLVVN